MRASMNDDKQLPTAAYCHVSNTKTPSFTGASDFFSRNTVFSKYVCFALRSSYQCQFGSICIGGETPLTLETDDDLTEQQQNTNTRTDRPHRN